VLARSSGKQLLNTRAAWGDPLPEISGNHWREVVAGRKSRVSDLYLGQIANAQVFTVSVPVKKGSKVSYVLSAAISPERIFAVLKRANLDKGWIAVVADRNGMIVARSTDFPNFLPVPRQLEQVVPGSSLPCGAEPFPDPRFPGNCNNKGGRT
jgi:hypothetical protein